MGDKNKLRIHHYCTECQDTNSKIVASLSNYAKFLFDSPMFENSEINIVRNIDLMFGDNYCISVESEESMFVPAHQFMINFINDGIGAEFDGSDNLHFSTMWCDSSEEEVTDMINLTKDRYNTEFRTEVLDILENQANAVNRLMGVVETQSALIQHIGVDKFPDIVRELINHLPYENVDECKENINAILARTVN